MAFVAQPPVTEWVSIVNEYKNTTNVEIEMRLGNMFNGHFDSNIGRDVFEKINRRLLKYNGWESYNETADVVYNKDNYRMIIDENTDEQTHIEKTRIVNKNFKLAPFDMRMSVSTEVPCKEKDTEMDGCRSRRRRSFIRKNLRIDLTEVSGDPDDLDDEQDTQYQVELEIIDPTLLKDDNEIINLVYKVYDVLKISA